MCLTLPSEVKVDKPLVCYKTVEKCDDGGYRSPYRYTTIGKDTIRGKKPYRARRTKNDNVWGNSKNGGYIHAYADLKSAAAGEYFDFFKRMKNEYKEYDTYVTPEVWECEIPVSDEKNYCFRGAFDDNLNVHAVCSREIVFRRKMEENELLAAYESKKR